MLESETKAGMLEEFFLLHLWNEKSVDVSGCGEFIRTEKEKASWSKLQRKSGRTLGGTKKLGEMV